VTSSHFDVVVLGADLAPLTCAALLAKRGFRVLVLGQGRPPPAYRLGAFQLPRRPCVYTAHGTPIAERVLAELGLHPSVRRVTSTVDPALQVALPDHRFDVAQDTATLDREIEREFPRVKRPALDLFTRVEELSGAIDTLFARDMAWPPDSVWDRRMTARASAHLPFERDTTGPDLLHEFPEEHPFRAVALACHVFLSDAETSPPPALGVARLLARARNAPHLDGGYHALATLLRERLIAHGGTLGDERAQAVVVRRGAAVAVALAGSDDEVSADFIVSGVDLDALLRLVPDRSPFEELFDRYGEPRVRRYRYTLNALVPTARLPEAWRARVFRLAAHRATDTRGVPTTDDACHLQRSVLNERLELITIETLLPSGRVENEHGYLESMRERLLHALEDVAPFTRERCVAVDSPCDGRPPDAFERGFDVSLERSERRGPETMTAVHDFPVVSQHGLCALPVRSPIRRLLLCNAQVLPSLGMEGQWLAAATTARIITRSDRSRAWMRRRPWSGAPF
jgi:hypothetical protein